MTFFRVQKRGYSFPEMASHNSADGGDGESEGLAVSSTPSGVDGGSRFGGAWDAMDDDDEVVIIKGSVINRIYDGYRILPREEVARFTIAEWKRMLADGSASDYE